MNGIIGPDSFPPGRFRYVATPCPAFAQPEIIDILGACMRETRMTTPSTTPTTATPVEQPPRPSAPLLIEISPDDLSIIQKRQEWRLRIARICVDFFAACERSQFATVQRGAASVARLGQAFDRIADHARDDLQLLLVTGIAVHDLEAARHRVNYFLDQVIQYVRHALQERGGSHAPLESADLEDIERETREALLKSPRETLLYIEDLVKLEEFEMEVRNQRQRIRLLLGGDRRLAALGSNEAVIYAELDEFWRTVEHFFQIFVYLRENLPPLLEQTSPYPELERELQHTHEHFQGLVERKVRPLDSRYQERRTVDAALLALEESLRHVSAGYSRMRQDKISFLMHFPAAGGRVLSSVEVAELREALGGFSQNLERLLEQRVKLVDAVSRRRSESEAQGQLKELLERIRAQVPTLISVPINTALEVLGAADGQGPRVEVPRLQQALQEMDEQVSALQQTTTAAVRLLAELREENARPLREQLCAVIGELRTFLQTSFAHIAAKDPRSTESSYHFFLREFSEEAQQALLLLKEMKSLGVFVGGLEQFRVGGLPLTPENLARILRVLFDEKQRVGQRIPSGEGWQIVASFLETLHGELVPRLQKLYSMEGVRFEDKDFLTRSAAQLYHSCLRCLIHHQMGYGLVQDIGRLRETSEASQVSTYLHLIVSRTCREMQHALQAVCLTLTSLIPYLGIMRDGVERRASLFFHRQQEVLQSRSRD